jgi:bifunctional UDP-N-acetylglucosamine pyrophosphorylase/glucosamine-1-phosphate N-acetyltransferase
MQNLGVIILAAGRGTRMKSKMPKVLFRIAGKPMLFYPINVAKQLKTRKIAVVVGYEKEKIIEELNSVKGIKFVTQKKQLGTGHAVLSAEKEFRNFHGSILILSGDVPLISIDTLMKFIEKHNTTGTSVSFISANMDNPRGYGRVIRDDSGRPWKIVEEVDATATEKSVKEINAGIYLVDSDFLFSTLRTLSKNNKQGEYYLPQIVSHAYAKGKKIDVFTINERDEVFGINNRLELSEAERKMQKRIIHKYAMAGVTFINPETTYLDYDVKIMPDTVIYPNTYIRGNTTIGRDCVIEQGVTLVDVTVGNAVHIKPYSVIEKSNISSGAQIGPFAHIRPDCLVKENVRIGNFVELKNTTIGANSKAAHLSYLGDATIGKDVNIGCGTITCNYDGFRKNRTVIEDGAFIGSDTQLVAPVRIGKFAYIGAGSTITKDVPPKALGITRVKQNIILNYYDRLHKRQSRRGK